MSVTGLSLSRRRHVMPIQFNFIINNFLEIYESVENGKIVASFSLIFLASKEYVKSVLSRVCVLN